MGYSESEIKAVQLACYISAFITPLLSTMMNLSLVNIGEEFGTGSHDLAYINTSFLLSSVIFMVPSAKLADIIGKKRLFIIDLLIIIIGCAIACLAPNFWVVIIGRAIIGMGAAGLATVSISMLTDIVPKGHRGSVIGYQTMFVYMGLALGPAIGGVVNDLIGWRLLFLLVVPLAVASLIVINAGFRSDIRNDSGGVFDTRSAVLYGFAILLTMGGVINLPQTWSYIAILIGVVVMILFIRSQIGNSHCLLDMSLFKIWTFSGSCIATFMSYAASYSISFFLALYLQSIGQLTSSEAGLLMIIQPAIQCICTPFFGKMTDKVSNKVILPTMGMVVTAIGVLSFAMYSVDTPTYVVVISMLTTGFGFAMFSAPNTTLIMSSVPKTHTSEASGMIAVMRQTGMMVSMGIAMLFITVIMGSTDNLGPDTYDTFLEVMKYSMVTSFIMCVIGTITSAVRGSPKKI